MKTMKICPVRGKMSVGNNDSDNCSAPFRAGEHAVYPFFYRFSAPNGTGTFAINKPNRPVAISGFQHCPERGKTSVEYNIQIECSAPFGAGEHAVHPFSYQFSVPNGTDTYPIDNTNQPVAISGFQRCPVWGKTSVEYNIQMQCSAPFGAGEHALHPFSYQYSVPNGTDTFTIDKTNRSTEFHTQRHGFLPRMGKITY